MFVFFCSTCLKELRPVQGGWLPKGEYEEYTHGHKIEYEYTWIDDEPIKEYTRKKKIETRT